MVYSVQIPSSFGTVQKLGVNTPAMVDNTAAAIISTGATGNKGLLIQGVSGQTANLFELQSYDGTFLVGANTSGQVGLSVSPGAGVGAKFAVSTAGIGFNSETTSTNDNTRLVLNNTSGTQTNGLFD